MVVLVTEIINPRPILHQTGLSDEELTKHVNELTSYQAERQSKLTCERRSVKINKCKVENSEIKTSAFGDNSKILAEIRAIKSDIQSPKQQIGYERSKDNRGVTEFGKPT